MTQNQVFICTESLDHRENFREKDKRFFKDNPHQSFYLRARLENEILPHSPPYIVVFKLGRHERLRFPWYESTISDDEIKQLKLEFKQQFQAVKKMIKSKPKLKRNKIKGFG